MLGLRNLGAEEVRSVHELVDCPLRISYQMFGSRYPAWCNDLQGKNVEAGALDTVFSRKKACSFFCLQRVPMVDVAETSIR